MEVISSKTKSFPVLAEDKKWILVDAKDQVVGRLATRIAYRLRGKHKVDYTPNIDGGDHVVVVNADRIRFTGRKWQKKEYIRHTGYPGGQRRVSARLMQEKHPMRILEHAVRGMLGKGSLGRMQFRHLYIYTGDQHPHQAQQPELMSDTAS